MTSLKNLLLVFMLILLMAGCHNEPYELFPLGVSTVTASTSTARYTYRQQRIHTFVRTSKTDTVSMEFHYAGEGIDRIIADSTEEAYKLILVTGAFTLPSIDSTFLVTDASQTLLQVRRYTYGANQQLAAVAMSSWGEFGVTQTTYELTWEGNNVTEIRKHIVDPLGAQNESILLASYDNKPGVYTGGATYLYTIKIDELYWLSANNPVSLSLDDQDAVILSYTYNKFEYPSQIRTDRGLLIGHSYVEMR